MKHVVTLAMTGIAFIPLFAAPHTSQPAEPPATDRTATKKAAEPDPDGVAAPAFRAPGMWEYSAPLIGPERRDTDPSHAQKDPSVVFYGGKWHVWMTVKLPKKSVIEYCSFARWKDADRSPRTILKVSDGDYYCAPQVFYFSPHKLWYLIYQVGVPGVQKMWVAYSTTANVADPASWTRARPILDGGENDPRREGGLDYWIICDDQRAYLFLTSLNGKLWRLWTKLEDFPRGFAHCELALQAEIFEASHTYRLQGLDKYLTIVEENGRRYYKAYLADRLDGPWTPVADTAERPFAGWRNVRPAAGVAPWTDNISHGELIRDGYDQALTVDPGDLRFVFQGMWDKDKSGKTYGQYPWRIGIATPAGEVKEAEKRGSK
ncbi:MAG: glycoside hydrolase [Candidatus Anammoximicrobium sp.]|nr:glycoside hydrolase [Candidatus Anammoximicrobium sp.]